MTTHVKIMWTLYVRYNFVIIIVTTLITLLFHYSTKCPEMYCLIITVNPSEVVLEHGS